MTVATVTDRISESFFGDSEGFFNASSTTSALVPQAFHLALGGRPFMLDLKSDIVRGYKCIGPITIPVIREQSDSSSTPGAASLNRQDAWRKVLTSWHHGAGQTWLDDADSDDFRFRTSKGVNPWTKGQLSLLNPAVAVTSVTNAIQGWAVRATTGGTTRRYYVDANSSALFESTNAPGGTSVTFSNVQSGVTIDGSVTGPYRPGCTDGVNSYIIVSPQIVKRTAAGVNSNFCALVAGTPRFLAWVKGRLLLGMNDAGAPKLYDCTSGTASSAFAFQNTTEYLVNAAEAGNFVYVATRSNRTSTIYAATADSISTALTLSTVAASLPHGETINDIFGYAGLLFVGTNLGFRLCAPGSDGTLTIGSLVAIGSVQCFTAYGQFIWFGWSRYDTTSGGLGRIDPTSFTDDAGLVPAYATDIMGATQESVTSCYMTTDEFNVGTAQAGLAVPHFITSTSIWSLNTQALVSSGTLDTGFTTYGLTDQKVATAVDVRTEALVGTVGLSLTNVHGGSSATIDTFNATGSTGSKFPVNYLAGSEHEINLTLTASGTSSPVLTAMTLFANPAPERGELYQLPLLLSDEITDLGGKKWKFDPWQELAAIRAMASPALAPVVLQLGTQSIDVFIEDYENHIHHELRGRQYSSVCIVTCKNLRQQAAV